MLWDDCPDGANEEDSHFFPGYLEIFIFGTERHSTFGFGHWHTTFVCPKDNLLGISEFDNDFLLVELPRGAGFADIEVGEANLRNPGTPKHPAALVDFEHPDGTSITKAFVLMADGVIAEIPDETLH
jgi:hypothetical protein